MSEVDHELKSEPRGAHWVAWLAEATRAGLPAPLLMVGATQEEAVQHLREWLAARRERLETQGD